MQPFNVIISLLSIFITTQVMAVNDALWQVMPPASRASSGPVSEQFYQVDEISLKQYLSRADVEGRPAPSSQITLPLANGRIETFSLELSPIMAPELAAKFPEIQTYKVHGIDNPHASGRLSMTPKGFHGMITSPSGSVYIDPTHTNTYEVYARKSQHPTEPFNCGVAGHNHESPVGESYRPYSLRTAGSLNKYRLALAATTEYVIAAGGTKDAAMSKIVTTINRVNQIYERDLAIRLELVGNNSLLLYIGDDPYTNLSDALTLTDNQANIDSVIGFANYDIGHVFTTSGGGVAQVGSVCSSIKAQGVTGLGNPFNEIFYIDYVAHEIGHQFSAEHTFNGTSNSCGLGNREADFAVEPGSGSTIMGYAGICNAENIQSNSDAVFHAGSIGLINNFTTTGLGASCGSIHSITNNDNQPVANAGNDFTIPTITPFILSGSGSDNDGDTLSYAWDQMDTGTATDSLTHGTDLGDNPLFRSHIPQAESFRYFPRLDTVLNGNTDKAETLPTQPRNLNFTLTVRDGKSGIAQDQMIVTTEPSSVGPFAVTSHENSFPPLAGGSSQNVTWSVGNTNSSPINCATVNVDLMKFDNFKSSYCEERLITAADNTGTVSVTLPDEDIDVARFKISCSDNIFYALSTADLSVQGATTAEVNCHSVLPNEESHDNVAVTIESDGTSLGGSTGGDSGSMGIFWLLSLFPLALLRRKAGIL